MSNENENLVEHIEFAEKVSLVLVGYPSSSPITMDDLRTRLPDLELSDGLQVVLQDMMDNSANIYTDLILLPVEDLNKFVADNGNTTEKIQYTLAFGEHSNDTQTEQVLNDIESNGYTNFLCYLDME